MKVIVPARGRLDATLADACADISRSRLARLIRDGQVTVDGEVCTRPALGVRAGAVLELELPAATLPDTLPQDIPIDIVYQDEALAVVNKAPGMVVHPGAGHGDGTLVNALLHHVRDLSGIGGVERPGIVHRLDRGTSGLLVVAKDDQAHQHLSAQFADHSAGRRYVAVCLGGPPSGHGTVRSFLGRHPTDRLRFASVDDEERGKRAVTHWRCLAATAGASVVACELETGRTHQIRVHMTEQGWPLAGDPLYRRGDRRIPPALRGLLPDERPMLHGWGLGFTHPRTGEAMFFEVPPPDDFLAVLAALELDWATLHP